MNKILMVGPHLNSMGGISHVVKTWKKNGILRDFNITYLPSQHDFSRCKYTYLGYSLLKYILNLLFKSNVVYIHVAIDLSFWRKSIYIAIGILLNKKIILHIHPNHFYDFYMNLKGIRRFFSTIILKRIYIFVVLSNELKNKLSKIFPNSMIVEIPNVISTTDLEPEFPVIRKSDQLLFLGWFIKLKGVYDLVDAVELLIKKDIKITLEFYGTKEIDLLKDYVNHKKLASYIHVNGWIEGKEKLKSFYSATCLVLPSYHEGVPIVILEAMATKTPIISTAVGGIPEVLRDGENAILIQPGNPAELSEKILMILNDKKLRDRLAARAYEDVTTKYNISVVITKFREIMNSIS